MSVLRSSDRSIRPPAVEHTSSWEQIYPFEELSQLRPQPGVYCIYCSAIGLVYIGESTNVRARFKQHGLVLMRYSLSYKSAQFGVLSDPLIKVSYSVRFGEEAMRERRLIRRLQPHFNQRGRIRPIISAEAMPLQQANG